MSMEANDLKASLLEASLVIPTHNRSQQLRRCLEALQAAGSKAHLFVFPLTAHEWLSWRRNLFNFALLLFQD